MKKTVVSCATPNGRILCELLSSNTYGSTVFDVHVYEANDNYEYHETHRSYPTGSMRKAMITYKQYRNRYLRSKICE